MNYLPVPEQQDYNAAIELTDEDFTRLGGAWFIAFASEMTTHEDRGVHEAMLDAVTYASAMEPLDDDGEPLDPLLAHTHAFKHGMMAGNYASNFVHGELINTVGILNGINRLTDLRNPTGYDRADTIVSIGENGLALVGEAARERIDAWSDDAVSTVESRRMYSLGCGAVLFTAYTIHTNYNQRVFEAIVHGQGIGEEGV